MANYPLSLFFKGFLDETRLLATLRGKPGIIQLIDHQLLVKEQLMYVLLEYGDTDLARLLHRQEKARKERGESGYLDENFIRLYWEQMLRAVGVMHEARIVHSDLKPANFLVVEGQLKLIDFGIAKAIQQDTTSIARESQVGDRRGREESEHPIGGDGNVDDDIHDQIVER